MAKKGTAALKPTQFLQVVPPPPPVGGEVRFVVPARYKAGALKALDDIKALFGKGGRNWIQYAEHEYYEVGERHPMTGKVLERAFEGFCLVGGLKAVDGRYEAIAWAALGLAIVQYQDELDIQVAELEDEYDSARLQDEVLLNEGTITEFNDFTTTHWDDIKEVLKLAKKLVAEAPSR